MTGVTFGCGQFLPGFGPFNFITIPIGGGADVPNNGGPGDGWEHFDGDVDLGDGPGGFNGGPPGPGIPGGPPGTKTYWICKKQGPWKSKCVSITKPDNVPPPPGAWANKKDCDDDCTGNTWTGGGITGPPPGGGPSTPPQPPGAPGPGTPICTCKIKGKPEKQQLSGPGYKGTRLIWKQKCSPGFDYDSQGIIEQAAKEVLEDLKGGSNSLIWKCEVGDIIGDIGVVCTDVLKGTCNGKCDGKISIEVMCIRQTEGGGEGEGTGPGSMSDDDWTGWDKTNGHDDDDGVVILDGGEDGFFTGGTTGSKSYTGAGNIESSNQNNPPPIANLGATIQNSNFINLNSPQVNNFVKKHSPVGLMNPQIAITGAIPSPSQNTVKNTKVNDPIFGTEIHKSIDYLRKNNNHYKDWDSTQVYSLTHNTVIQSLNPTFLNTLRSIKTIDGTPISDREIYALVSERLIDGTIDDLITGDYFGLRNTTKSLKKTTIQRSSDPTINELAGVSLLEQNLFSLDPSAYQGTDSQILKNWKVFSTDVNKYVEVRIGDELKRYYIGDSNELLQRSSLALKDGEYIDIKKDGKSTRLYAHSEIDHAYMVQESTRQQAIKLLGGTGKRTLSVSAPTSDNLEFDYSLSSTRKKVYVMKIIPSSVETTDALLESNLLKNTTCRYELMEAESREGVSAVNEFIKYKANYRSYFLSQDDLIFDYLESTSAIHITQEDILFDSPKTNKSQALLVRQVPWYIFILPSNREDYLSFGGKSTITDLDPSGATTRQISTSPAVDANLSNQANHPFVTYATPYFEGIPDVYGLLETQTRISVFNPTDLIYSTTCVSAGVRGSVSDFNFTRKKTSFRLIREILQELNNNYVLDREGTGLGVNTFDVISRLALTEFNKFTAMENSRLLFPLIRNGLVDNIKVYAPIKNSGTHSDKLTRLIQRRATATTDKFIGMKSMEDNQYIIPPTEVPYSSEFGTITNVDKALSVPRGRD